MAIHRRKTRVPAAYWNRRRIHHLIIATSEGYREFFTPHLALRAFLSLRERRPDSTSPGLEPEDAHRMRRKLVGELCPGDADDDRLRHNFQWFGNGVYRRQFPGDHFASSILPDGR